MKYIKNPLIESTIAGFWILFANKTGRNYRLYAGRTDFSLYPAVNTAPHACQNTVILVYVT